MSVYTIQIEGTHPAQDAFDPENAAETAGSIAKCLEDQGHSISRLSVNHGNLKGGTFDFIEERKAHIETPIADTKFAAAD